MRTEHTLWRVSNGWLLVPEGDHSSGLNPEDASECVVFKSLKEFADQYPKRERRKRKTKPTQGTKQDAN